MRMLIVAALCVLAFAPLAEAQSRDHVRPRRTPSVQTGHTVTAPQPVAPSRPALPPHIFTIGNLPVGLWAPVPPPYDARANHNNAANPLWWDDGQM